MVSGLRIGDVSQLFAQAAVVTLFTHWTSHGIEFSDGVASLPAVVEQVPPRFSGVLDLCVCHPDDLVRLLADRRELCTVKYLSNIANPIFWLAFYDALYKLLALRRGRTYPDELTDLEIEFRRR